MCRTLVLYVSLLLLPSSATLCQPQPRTTGYVSIRDILPVPYHLPLRSLLRSRKVIGRSNGGRLDKVYVWTDEIVGGNSLVVATIEPHNGTVKTDTIPVPASLGFDARYSIRDAAFADSGVFVLCGQQILSIGYDGEKWSVHDLFHVDIGTYDVARPDTVIVANTIPQRIFVAGSHLYVTHAYALSQSPANPMIATVQCLNRGDMTPVWTKRYPTNGLGLTNFTPRELIAAGERFIAIADADRYRIRILDGNGDSLATVIGPARDDRWRPGTADSIFWGLRKQGYRIKTIMDSIRPYAYGNAGIARVVFLTDRTLLVTCYTGYRHDRDQPDGAMKFRHDLWNISEEGSISLCGEFVDSLPGSDDVVAPAAPYDATDGWFSADGVLFRMEPMSMEGMIGRTWGEVWAARRERAFDEELGNTIITLNPECP